MFYMGNIWFSDKYHIGRDIGLAQLKRWIGKSWKGQKNKAIAKLCIMKTSLLNMSTPIVKENKDIYFICFFLFICFVCVYLTNLFQTVSDFNRMSGLNAFVYGSVSAGREKCLFFGIIF